MSVDFDRQRAAELYRQAATEVEAGKYREAEQSVSIAHMYVSALKRHDPQPPAPPTARTVPIVGEPAPTPTPIVETYSWDTCECNHDRIEHDGDGACLASASSGARCSCPSFKIHTS